MPDLLSAPFLIFRRRCLHCRHGARLRRFRCRDADDTDLLGAVRPAVGIALCLLLEIAVALPLPGVVRLVDWRRIGCCFAAALAVPHGTHTLTGVEPEPMRWAISAIILGAVILLASGWRFPRTTERRDDHCRRATSGFLNGLSGMAGPPIAFYYLAGNEPAARVRANLTTYFVFVDLIALASFASRGLIGWNTGVQGLFLAPAVMLGGLVGERLFPLASEKILSPPGARPAGLRRHRLPAV